MARHILPLVLLVVALVVRLILSAPMGNKDEVNNFRPSLVMDKAQASILGSIIIKPCDVCYVRDYAQRCRLNFTCLLG